MRIARSILLILGTFVLAKYTDSIDSYIQTKYQQFKLYINPPNSLLAQSIIDALNKNKWTLSKNDDTVIESKTVDIDVCIGSIKVNNVSIGGLLTDREKRDIFNTANVVRYNLISQKADSLVKDVK